MHPCLADSTPYTPRHPDAPSPTKYRSQISSNVGLKCYTSVGQFTTATSVEHQLRERFFGATTIGRETCCVLPEAPRQIRSIHKKMLSLVKCSETTSSKRFLSGATVSRKLADMWVSSPRDLLLLILMTFPRQSQRPLPSQMRAHGRPATTVPSVAVGLDGAASFPGEPPYFVPGTVDVTLPRRTP